MGLPLSAASASLFPAALVPVVVLLAAMAGCQEPSAEAAPVLVSESVVEAACGQCQFGLPGKGCDLAVRIDGTAYFVDGTSIDEHGDAHAADGFCNAVRRARVSGELVGGRFAARTFELLPGGGE